MHELSLAGEIIRATSEKLGDLKGAFCTRLRVRVGELSAVNADNLRFCVEAGMPAKGVGVEVETVRPKLVCSTCGEVECEGRFDTVCPRCGGGISGVVGGLELEVQLEWEDSSERRTHEG
jgi:Zn finger protein HypA/HybF involved in hydrogenase expression